MAPYRYNRSVGGYGTAARRTSGIRQTSYPQTPFSPTVNTGYRAVPVDPFETSFGGLPTLSDLMGPGAQRTPAVIQPRPSVTPAPAQSSSDLGAGRGSLSLDYSGDPILQKIKALGQQNVADAQAGATNLRKQALIGHGYAPELAPLFADTSTAQAAQQNPFSTLAQLAAQHTSRTRDLDETLNKENLFYSGERGRQLGLEGQQYLGDQAAANTSLQSLLGQIEGGVTGAQQNAALQAADAEQAAYDRAVQFALQTGATPPPVAAGPAAAAATPAAATPAAAAPPVTPTPPVAPSPVVPTTAAPWAAAPQTGSLDIFRNPETGSINLETPWLGPPPPRAPSAPATARFASPVEDPDLLALLLAGTPRRRLI